MNTDFSITRITRIAMVDKDEYRETTTAFGNHLASNEIIFHFSGEATVYFDDEVLATRENTIRFLPSGDTKKYVVKRKKHGECILIAFDTDAPISPVAFTLDAGNSPHIGNLFRKAFAVWVSRQDGFYFDCLSLLYKIFAELQKNSYLPQKQYDKIKPAVEFIENNFTAGKISAAYLADLCKISDSYLKKLFIKKFGVSPIGYIIQLKMNYAGDLLRTGLYAVTDVAKICGYDSIYYFSRQFKAHTGITPTEYKSRYKSSK